MLITEFDKVRSAQIKFNQTGKPITRAGEIQKELLKKIVTITQEKDVYKRQTLYLA